MDATFYDEHSLFISPVNPSIVLVSRTWKYTYDIEKAGFNWHNVSMNI